MWFPKKDLYIDDLLKLFDKDSPKHIWEMKIWGYIENYLGIKIEPVTEGRYRLTNEDFIKKVLKEKGIQEGNPENNTTTSTGLLGKDCNVRVPKRQHKRQYDSVIGMMIYLASNRRHTISFAVHHCETFTHCVKSSHDNDVLRM